MIAEPYICIKGWLSGQIQWMAKHPDGRLFALAPVYNSCNLLVRDPLEWQTYADFEREKLGVLGIVQIEICPLYSSPKIPTGNAFFCSAPKNDYGSVKEIDYWNKQYITDPESSRLFKRAEFLKAVCEKEGVEWLPEQCGTSHGTSDDQGDPASPETCANGCSDLFGRRDKCLVCPIKRIAQSLMNTLDLDLHERRKRDGEVIQEMLDHSPSVQIAKMKMAETEWRTALLDYLEREAQPQRLSEGGPRFRSKWVNELRNRFL